ncbi:MAG: CdaR family protein [Chloroflexota bacterium]|nr:CdaR family protein [Chloroflexota bacterium]
MASAPQQTNRSTSSGVISRAVLAVVLAFGFWAWVTNNNDPDRRRDFPNVPVTQNDLPDGLSVIDFTPQTVTVSIWGPRSVVTNPALQAGNFSATIDLKDAKPGTQQVPIRVQSDLKNLRKKSASSATAQVTIERSIAKTLPVTVPTPTQSGVTVNNVTPTPATVSVSGPESKVNAVTQAVAALDIGDRTTSFTSPPVDVKAVDASGKDVAGVIISPSRVTVAVDLTDNRNERVVPISTADVTGAPAAGFKLDTIVVTPNQVTLMGDPQVIRTIPNIPTQPIVIDGLNQATTLTVPLDMSKLPLGVTIKNNVTSVQVLVNIVEVTQDIAFQVPIQPVNLRPGLQPSLLSQREVTITLRGTRQQLDQINGTNIVALANLASFTGPGGPKSVTVEVQLPSGSPVTVIKTDPPAVDVTVTAIPTPTPVPTPTSVPTPTPLPTPRPTATPRPPTATAAP